MGQLLRILILVALVAAVVWWLRRGRRLGGKDAGVAKGAKREGPAPPAQMVACAHCGVHLPQSDALADPAGRSYCSDAHRLAGPR